MYKVLRLKEVLSKTGLAKSTVYKMIGEGEFPKQFSLSGRSVGWLESDINKWIGDKVLIAANDNGAANDNSTLCVKDIDNRMELVSTSKMMVSCNDNLID